MKIYTEINWQWNEDKQKLVEVSSESIDYNGDLELCGKGMFGKTTLAPSEGGYGWLGGAAKGSILGTLRRVGDRSSATREQFVPEGTPAGNLTPRDITDYSGFQSRWLNQYMGGKEADITRGSTGRLADIRTATPEMQTLGFQDMFLREELQFEDVARDYEQAGIDWGKAQESWGQAQTQYALDVAGTEEEYKRRIREVSGEQAGEVSKSYAQGMKLGGEESQAGFAYSGPQEQLRGIQEESTRAQMQNYLAEKQKLKDVKITDLYDLEQGMYGPTDSAQSTFEAAESAWGRAGLDRDLATDELMAKSIEALRTTEENLMEKGIAEQNIEQGYVSSSTGKANDLWQNLAQRSKFQDWTTRLKSMRENYERLREAGITFPGGRMGGATGRQTGGGAGY